MFHRSYLQMISPCSFEKGSFHSAETSVSGFEDYTHGSRQSSFQLQSTFFDDSVVKFSDISRGYIYALDNATTKLAIPLSAIEPTKALEDDGFVPGICRLFLEGRCRQNANCFQVHVQPSVVEKLREKALQTPSCCYSHGAPCSFDGFPCGLTVTVEKWEIEKNKILKLDETNEHHYSKKLQTARRESSFFSLPKTVNGDCLLSIYTLLPTSFLWNLYKNTGSIHLKIPPQKVCREHIKGLCRFGDECCFLHGCRAILAGTYDLSRKSTPQAIEFTGSLVTENGSSRSELKYHDNGDVRFCQGISNNHFGISQNSLNYGETPSNSLGSRRLCSISSSKNESYGDKKKQLLKPLGNRSATIRSGGPSNTSFSHNPYAQVSF